MIEYTVKVNDNGDRSWWCRLTGLLHRIDGPAVELSNGTRYWYLNGKRHREDGPAIEWANGDRSWWLSDKLHREDGPALEAANGTREWYRNGECHREDGPAVEFANGDRYWYLNGVEYYEEEFLEITKQQTHSTRGESVYNGKVWDAIDNLVVASLQDYYNLCSKQNNYPTEEFINEVENEEMLDAIKLILSHYMTGIDYDEWLRSVERENNGI